jgi:hypothetical protein
VRARAVMVPLSGLILAVPLILIAIYVARDGIQRPIEEERAISPVLSFEERRRLPTYQRECGGDKECEPPLGCLQAPALFKFRCTDSECVTDEQCREGFTCQVLRTVKGPLVRACIPVGVRQEGQRCVAIPADQEEACAPGLICGGDWCGRPCKKGVAESCPQGFFCTDVSPGPLCLPTCEARGCPEGQACVAFHPGTSACAVVHGVNCQQQVCLSGQECVRLDREDRPGEVWMECATRCGKDNSSCPEGTFCHRTYCHTPCDPEGSNTCKPGYYCGRFRTDEPWVCRFDRRRKMLEDSAP